MKDAHDDANSALARYFPPGFPAVDGCLQIGGVSIRTLEAQVGSTPFYAYDGRLIARRVDELRKLLPQTIELYYAVKANPMPALVHHMASLVDGFDVASAGELNIVLGTPIARTRVSFAGPGKREHELARAIEAGISIHLESAREMETVHALGLELKARPRVAVRINPDFELKRSGMSMGGGARQFGVDAEQVPKLLERLAKLTLDFEGFHVFAGSQNLHSEAILEAQRRTIELAIALSAHAPSPLRLLNLGGGFGIPYSTRDRPLDVEAIGRELAKLLAPVRERLPQARVVIELGRYLVGEAGIYVCRVIDRKVSRGQVFLVTDGGLHHHLAASGNFGRVIPRNYPMAVGTRMSSSRNEGKRETVSVVGCLCTPLDLLADRVELPEAQVGDLIVVFQSGAYGRSASPLGFLSHPPPEEVLLQ